MKLLKPQWISHGGNPIYSLSIHPDGTRLATGGQGADNGVVILWNMEPIRSEVAEHDTEVPKKLCELTNHLGCVNCVKWSNNGQWLASSGDDAIIMLWSLRSKVHQVSAFGSSVEQWGCGHMLRGHSGDVLDISWSHDDRYLASASVDNCIIVWNGVKLPEKVISITTHTGLVKGITWDPIGRYMASQSDDKSVRVWRVSDWKEEAKITQPFIKCGGTTQMLRLSWSPDGRFIVSAHSLNNDGPTAHIIERNSWKTGMDFVGHRKAIEVVSFNPQLFLSGKGTHGGCIAIGSRDRSVSVWLTTCKRPLVVVHELFNNSVVDLSWSSDGYSLMACSLDGTCAYLSFSEDELGARLNEDGVNDMLVDLYGTSKVTRGDSRSDILVEDPALLTKRDSVTKQQATPTCTPSITTPKQTMITSSPSTNEKQVETRTKDGRRRIKPITLTTVESTGVDAVFSSPLSQQPLTPSTSAPVVDTTSKPTFSTDTQSLSAAKSVIGKRPHTQQQDDSTSKQKRMKKTKDHTAAAGDGMNRHQSLSVGCLLPRPTSQSSLSVNVISTTLSCTVEVSNSYNGDCTVSCEQNEGQVWTTSLTSMTVSVLSASSHVTCIGFEDHSVMFLSTLTGRTLFPRIIMPSPLLSVTVSSHFVGIAMVNATFTVYNTSTFTYVVNSVSFSHLFQDASEIVKVSVTDDGIPVVVTDSQVYCYNTSMMSWVTVATNTESSIVRSSKFALLSLSQLTPLQSLQRTIGSTAASSSSIPPSRSATLMYLESQIGRSVTVCSVLEYHHWVKSYVRYLVTEGMEERLREFMTSLQSPPREGFTSQAFIQECLNIVTTNTKLQRLYRELKDMSTAL